MRVSLNMTNAMTMAIKEVAGKNHRTVSSEIIVAIERHIKTEGWVFSATSWKWETPKSVEVGELETPEDDAPPF